MNSSAKENLNSTPDPSAYLPVAATVERVTKLTQSDRLFTLKPEGPSFALYDPGQFIMAGLPGYGEAPISISSAPMPINGRIKSLDICIRAVGNLTNALHRVQKGERIWIRGPFGRGFKTADFTGKDMIFIAGGIGIVPMRSLIQQVVNSGSFGKLTLVYGSKTPEEILFHGEMAEWAQNGLDVRLTIDKPHPAWKKGANVGVVTTLIPKIKVDPKNTVAVIIGPPAMYKFVVYSLREKRMTDENIFVSLERRMKCALGKCGHCQINSSYVCQEGPVYNLNELHGLPESL